MIGAIIGDVIGSVYEFKRTKDFNFDILTERSKFTDDTVMTIATARALLTNTGYAENYRNLGREYPASGYGSMFNKWLFSDTMGSYESYGNGSAMRVSPIGWAFEEIDDVLREAEKSAAVSHNHPEGIKGAQAAALAVLLARKRLTKEAIRAEITERFGYDLSRSCETIRPTYSFDETCQGTVPEAIIAFLDSDSFESAIRLAVSLGGDSDTLAAITGSIAQAFYREIPREIAFQVLCTLPKEFLRTIKEFQIRYQSKKRL